MSNTPDWFALARKARDAQTARVNADYAEAHQKALQEIFAGLKSILGDTLQTAEIFVHDQAHYIYMDGYFFSTPNNETGIDNSEIEIAKIEVSGIDRSWTRRWAPVKDLAQLGSVIQAAKPTIISNLPGWRPLTEEEREAWL